MLKRGLLIAAVALVADQLHKYLMLHQFGFLGGRVIEVTSFFNLVRVWNYGVSFGMMNNGNSGNAVALVAMSLVITGFLVYWLSRCDSKYQATAIGMVIGGALGNSIDRLIYGAVADFLDFHIGFHHWPSFNVADMAISTEFSCL